MYKLVKNKKNIIILLGLFIALSLGYFLFHNTKEIVIVPERPDFNTRDLSRVSFFHGKDIKCTMAIPADWEGEYRMREKGNEVSFSYIINPENSPLLFAINFYDQDAWQENESQTKILSLDDKVFTYRLSTDTEKDVEGREKFEKMKEDVLDIVKTLKCSNNK